MLVPPKSMGYNGVWIYTGMEKERGDCIAQAGNFIIKSDTFRDFRIGQSSPPSRLAVFDRALRSEDLRPSR